MEINFKSKLFELLKKDSRLWNKETDEFNETLLKDLVDKLDENILELLFNNAETKERFFIKIKDIYVLKQNELKFFIDENKLDNSFTQLANKIGLTIDDKKDEKVVLNWPFKDCVLEGGMTKEDAVDIYYKFDKKTGEWQEESAKRKEIFFNEILARDEIDRLEDPKALYKWQRFTVENSEKGEEVKEIKRDENGVIRENFVIKGNNLLALHSLKEEFEGKIKLIYIDPPYNTGGDSFGYNDNFNHSSWLTFMRNRLDVAKNLLTEDAMVFIQINDVEFAYLKVLMDELFGRENFHTSITVKMSHLSGTKMAHKEKKIPKIKEHLLIYSKNKNNLRVNPVYIPCTWDEAFDRYNSFLDKGDFSDEDCNKWKVITVNEALEIYSIDKKDEKAVLEFKMKNAHLIFRTARNRSADYSKLPKDKFSKINKNGNKAEYYFVYKGEDVNFAIDKIRKINGKVTPATIVGDIWNDIAINNLSNEGGVELRFGKKPEKLLKRIIEIATKEGDIVLDYHAGSGTTCAVAHKLGRQWIGIEQLDYSDNNPEERMKGVIAGDQTGISKEINWKGGGDFVYMQLAKWNEEAKEKITEAKSYDELVNLFSSLYEKYFLNYNVRAKDFKESIIENNEFKKLPLERQKEIFGKMLDLNQMYINFSERNDKKYELSSKDIELSEEFYNAKN